MGPTYSCGSCDSIPPSVVRIGVETAERAEEAAPSTVWELFGNKSPNYCVVVTVLD